MSFLKFSLLLFAIFSCNLTFSQELISKNDSLYIKFNTIPNDQKIFSLNIAGGLQSVAVRIKNKNTDSQMFGNKEYNSTFFLKKKIEIDKKNILSYEDYNKCLNKDYVNTIIKYKLFFIISEDKINYLLSEIKPLFPEGFIKM